MTCPAGPIAIAMTSRWPSHRVAQREAVGQTRWPSPPTLTIARPAARMARTRRGEVARHAVEVVDARGRGACARRAATARQSARHSTSTNSAPSRIASARITQPVFLAPSNRPPSHAGRHVTMTGCRSALERAGDVEVGDTVETQLDQVGGRRTVSRRAARPSSAVTVSHDQRRASSHRSKNNRGNPSATLR